ncbi:MAG: putative sugar kinase YdjH [Tenericutes bacterium ADurb.Bin239]|nr:MAG: putative sugar kinase YdjH [Tenericutes bacterium ADurb.Bin239]
MNKIYFAGNMIVDAIKRIEVLPKRGMLSKIFDEEMSVGGSACNTAINLKVIDPTIDIKVFGRVGHDEKGKFILDTYRKYAIDTTNVIIDKEKKTSYTDVMIEKGGYRTFYQYGGANDNLKVEDFNLDTLDCDIFHIGYLLLLAKLDVEDAEYGTKMARLLHKVQSKGIKTSIDVVSDTSDRYKKVVVPSLKYCNYVIINEIEAASITGIPARDKDDNIILSNIKKSIDVLFSLGVKDTVIIHYPECAVMKQKEGAFVVVNSFNIPKNKVISTVGAGDAFVAGALYALSNNLEAEMILKIAHASAAFNLFSPSSIDGAKPIKDIMKFINK